MYEILADMSIDIDEEFAAANDIKYIPMEFIVGGETRTVTEPCSMEYMHEYYDLLRNKVPTMTSQITPNNYVSAFEPYVRDGRSVLYLALSSGLSNTYSSALTAVGILRESYKEKVRIEVVDTLGATGGQGMLAEAACILRKNGLSLEDNANWLRERAHYIHYWFKVEDLMYLMRGGRVSGATAVIGTALNIKPVLIVDGAGKLETIAKKRGSRMAMKYLVDCYREARDTDSQGEWYPEGFRNLVYICCSDCPKDAEALKKMVLEANPSAIIRITSLSPVIGAHTGPDMIALIHFGIRKQA